MLSALRAVGIFKNLTCCFEHKLDSSYHFNGSNMLAGGSTKIVVEMEWVLPWAQTEGHSKGPKRKPIEIDFSFVPDQTHHCSDWWPIGGRFGTCEWSVTPYKNWATVTFNIQRFSWFDSGNILIGATTFFY